MSAYLGKQSAAQMRNASTPKDPTAVSAKTDTKAMEKRIMIETSVIEILAASTQCAEIQTARTPAAVKPVSKDTDSGVTTMTSAHWLLFCFLNALGDEKRNTFIRPLVPLHENLYPNSDH